MTTGVLLSFFSQANLLVFQQRTGDKRKHDALTRRQRKRRRGKKRSRELSLVHTRTHATTQTDVKLSELVELGFHGEAKRLKEEAPRWCVGEEGKEN